MGLLTFSIRGSNENPTKFVADARNFKITVDEPLELGGTDHAPNPVEYLLAGYAGCLNVVGHLVAKEQNIVINKLSIEIEGDINPERFLGVSYNDRAGFKGLRVKISVDSNAEQFAIDKWFAEVENRCPINDNLKNPTPIEIKVSTYEYGIN